MRFLSRIHHSFSMPIESSPLRSPRNRTLSLSQGERERLGKKVLRPTGLLAVSELEGRVLQGDALELLEFLPDSFVDLLILDPPYNLPMVFGDRHFGRGSDQAYLAYLETWFPRMMRLLKPRASVYLCGDWRTSLGDVTIMARHLHLRNRITWQREKGRGASANWKSGCEDIWFGTRDREYVFHLQEVQMRRRVLAPYRGKDGVARDWQREEGGRAYLLSCSSNFWDDLTVPFWAMAENTPHPTQKPEKLLAKLILASSNPGDFVFDPFLGSGTTAVVAKKLHRRFAGIELCQEYCCWALKRLEMAGENPRIQGYEDGVCWERKSAPTSRHGHTP